MAQTLKLDFDRFKVGEMAFIEETLNERFAAYLARKDTNVRFNDVIEQFNMDDDFKPRLDLSQGVILQVMAWVQLRRENPDGTWEEAGEFEMAPHDPKETSEVPTTTEPTVTPPDDSPSV